MSDEPPVARCAGILLHPTSLPGPHGIGDIGPRAHHWLEQLHQARQKRWQILPLGPTGYGDSPYQCFSAFAGNPALISPELLAEDGLVLAPATPEPFPNDYVAFGPVLDFKRRLLAAAWRAFGETKSPALIAEWEAFREAEAAWLDDYALFMALKDAFGGKSWFEWPEPLRVREALALTDARRRLADSIQMHQFGQLLFFRQWGRLRERARELGIQVIGDVPIFVAGDSADVWANPELFVLDAQRRPKLVAGVPPDYFSPTGQLWGNPVYDWTQHRETGYAWWTARLRATLRQVDVVRLDHFRGFEASWQVPAGAPTAETGRWIAGPGADLLTTLQRQLQGLPLIAEDLGVITPAVEALRCSFGLPGMRILQFAFGGAVEDRFLPHNFENPTVVYTGTHDNDTTRGWFDQITAEERAYTLRYLERDDHNIAWEFVRLAWSSVARLAIAPLQDILGLGTEARMNVPGRAAGNWSWRFTDEMLGTDVLGRLATLTRLYQRG